MAGRRSPTTRSKAAARPAAVGARTLIGERFQIERRAGAGASGTVYLARDRIECRPVALKILHAHAASGADRFLREARILSQLCHPGIYLSLSLMLAGRTAEAEDAAAQALEPCQSIPPALVVVWSALADARLAAGKLELARDAAEQAMRLLESLGKVEEGEAHCRRVHAMVLHATGDIEAARRAIAAARSRILAQADKISVAAARDHFLRSHEVARISSLATSWLGG